VINGRSSFLPEHGDIGGTVEDWVACGDLTLDDQSEKTRSFDKDENMAPHLRLTGVKVTLQMSYTNRHEDIKGDVATVCEIQVNVNAAWVSRPTTDQTVLADSALGITETRQRYRYAYGVAFAFEKRGSFSYMSPYALLSAVVNVIVILGFPGKMIRLIALYCLGLVSKVYSKVLRKPFNILRSFHVLGARMLAASAGFRTISNQVGTSAAMVEALPEETFRRLMEDVLRKHMPGMLEENIVDMAAVVMEGLDADHEKNVDMGEFVQAVAGEADMSAATLVKFFDKERRVLPTECMFDPTRAQIFRARRARGGREAWPNEVHVEPASDESKAKEGSQ
jgi:hypothetical protein